MSALPSFGLSLPPVSTNAHSDDFGASTLNTPVNVVAGNTGENLTQILEGLADLNKVQNQPALNTIATQAGGGGGAPWLWIAAAALVLVLVWRHRSGGGA